MWALIKRKPFKGKNDRSEDLKDYLQEIECAAEAFECHKSPTTTAGVQMSQKHFFLQSLSKDGPCTYGWQYGLLPEEKADLQSIKKKVPVRNGTMAIVAWSQFEIQNEVMALCQNPRECIVSYIEMAEKL
jgi:hypothetical protein